MIRFEETFANFLLHHQERHNRTYHFLILMDAITSAAKHIQQYYLTGALKGNLGSAGRVNVQGEDVMRMDQIAQQIVIHYLKASGRVISAVSEESKDVIPVNLDDGRYFVYFDPLDGSSNIAHGLPVGFLFGIAKRNLNGPEDGHLRAGKRLHRRRNVRDSHRHLHPGAEGRRRVAIPDRRDNDFRPAQPDDPARERRDLGIVVQLGPPPRLRRARAEVDRGQRA